MPNRETVRRLTSMGMFLLPIVVVKLAATVLGESAQQSAAALNAQPAAADASAMQPAALKWTPQQLAAARHVDWLKHQPFGHSPLLYDEDHSVVTHPLHTDTPDPSDGQAKLVLQAVMSSERGRTVVINGRPYREGDTVREANAVVQAIDCATRSATLRDLRSGQLSSISVDRPR